MTYNILGIDPGSLRTGFGILRVENTKLIHLDHGVIKLSDKLTFAERLNQLYLQLSKIMTQFDLEAVAIEKIFYGRNIDSAFKLGHARGVCMQVAAQNSLPVYEYAARYIKKCVTGSGSATKDHVQMVALTVLSMPKQKLLPDASDALALAITHARVSEVERRLSRNSKKLEGVEI